MEYLLVGTAALLTAGLTLFSGFGLGTLLMPVMALFFPVEVAIAVTAFVHLLNNGFKLLLLGKHASWPIVLRFGVPALGAAALGAWTLLTLAHLEPLATYTVLGRPMIVTPVKLSIAILILGFVIYENGPRTRHLVLNPRWLPFGGLLSGYFGGLSGHQGAFRSLFLLKCGLSQAGFIATGVVIGCLVDLVRLAMYGRGIAVLHDPTAVPLVATATIAAFLGSFVGSRLMHKIEMATIHKLVSVLLILIALGLGLGWFA